MTGLGGLNKSLHGVVVAPPSMDSEPAEVTAWRRAADSMYLPHDEKLGIILQDDDFLATGPLDVHAPAALLEEIRTHLT